MDNDLLRRIPLETIQEACAGMPEPSPGDPQTTGDAGGFRIRFAPALEPGEYGVWYWRPQDAVRIYAS